MPVVSVGSRVAYSEKVGWPRFSKALASALDRPNGCFSRQLWEGGSAPAAWVAASSGIALSRSFLRHRERPWGVPDGFSPGFPWQGKSGSRAVQGQRLMLVPRLFFRWRERKRRDWMDRQTRQAPKQRVMAPAGATLGPNPALRRPSRTRCLGSLRRAGLRMSALPIGQRATAGRKMAGHGNCKMDVFRESPSCANGRAQGTGLWKVRTVFRRSDNGRPSETQPKFGSRFYRGLCLGRNYPGIAAFWNERRNRCRDATHPAGPKVMHRAMRKKGSPQA
jgi:hypothetical protein